MTPASVSLTAATASHELASPLNFPQDPDLAAKKVEGMFLSMLIKELRETSNGEGLFPGDSAGIHGGIFDMMLGEFIAENSPGLGIGQEIARYMKVQNDWAASDGTPDDAAQSIEPDTTL